METAQDQNSQAFLNEVANAMDAAADQMDRSANGRPAELTTTSNEIWQPKFAQKLIYTSCYTLSFGICFPTFLACRYIPKNNSLVQGMIDGGAAATRDVDAWLAKVQESKQRASENVEDGLVAEAGAAALAPA